MYFSLISIHAHRPVDADAPLNPPPKRIQTPCNLVDGHRTLRGTY